MERTVSLVRELATKEIASKTWLRLASGATTRSIIASGAMACAHSTSSDVSRGQVEPCGSLPGGPSGRKVFTVAEGSPVRESKVARSEDRLELPKASIIAILVPVPLIPRA